MPFKPNAASKPSPPPNLLLQPKHLPHLPKPRLPNPQQTSRQLLTPSPSASTPSGVFHSTHQIIIQHGPHARHFVLHPSLIKPRAPSTQRNIKVHHHNPSTLSNQHVPWCHIELYHSRGMNRVERTQHIL
ncbi:hypothetical protein K440DRAFT_197566 [Wilcoxina mikolae CBS 423.85]|nr:hypothetical protein K440DRAFT_197566 [Wilcoxina mikolae CBS 423.85]